MPTKPINDVIADALRFYMADKWTNVALAKRAQVAEGTIRNCLDPSLRKPGAKGKEPSVKATELAKIADALGVSVAELVTEPTGLHGLLAERRLDAQTKLAIEVAKLFFDLPPMKRRIAYARLQELHNPEGLAVSLEDHSDPAWPESLPTQRQKTGR